MYDSSIWSMATIGGPVLLAVAIAYAIYRNRRMSRRTFEVGEHATKRLYDKDNPRS